MPASACPRPKRSPLAARVVPPSVQTGPNISLEIARSRRLGEEAPTVALLVGVHLVFAALVVSADALGVLAYVLLAPVIALHSSLQHEVLHGHPFRNPRLNALCVALPLGLAVPYWRFRALHMAHHVDPNLTDPHDDPESWYLAPGREPGLSPLLRAVLQANNTLAGRLLLGPAVGLFGFWRAELGLLRTGDRKVMRAWGEHLALALVLGLLLSLAPGITAAGYLGACYGAASLLSLRTFLEHRAVAEVGQRTVLIEDRGPFAWLFLFNSLHAVHHERPDLPWHRLPAAYSAERARYLEGNGGYVYRSYAEIARRYAFRRKEPLTHPLPRAGKAMLLPSSAAAGSGKKPIPHD